MRIPNWQIAQAAKIEEWRRRPFAYGLADCCQFAAEIVSAITGVDHRTVFPQYEDEAQAQAILAERGGIVGLVTSVLGEPKPVAFAMEGDVVVQDFGYGPAVGICIGVHSCAPGARGLLFRPVAKAIAAWSVG